MVHDSAPGAANRPLRPPFAGTRRDLRSPITLKRHDFGLAAGRDLAKIGLYTSMKYAIEHLRFDPASGCHGIKVRLFNDDATPYAYSVTLRTGRAVTTTRSIPAKCTSCIAAINASCVEAIAWAKDHGATEAM
jgi:hypothetical protein